MDIAEVKSHQLTIEYICPVTTHRVSITIDLPVLGNGYGYVEISCCRACGTNHTFQLTSKH